MESILLIILVSLVGALRWALEEHRLSGLARDEIPSIQSSDWVAENARR